MLLKFQLFWYILRILHKKSKLISYNTS